MYDSDPLALFSALAAELNGIELAYLHIIEPLPGHATFHSQEGVAPVAAVLRKIYKGTIIINGGYGKEQSEQALAEERADLVSLGGPFLANPDLPERFRRNLSLNEPDTATYYGGDEKGYTDYPFWDQN